jgi:hypothetical protein
MNKNIILTLIILLTISSTSHSIWPFSKKEVKPAVVATEKIEKVKPSIGQGRKLVKEIGVELRSAKNENSNLKTSLNKALLKLKDAEAKTLEVQKNADDLKEWGIIQQETAQKFIEKYNNAVKRYHRLKTLAAVIAAGVGILLGLQFMNLTPPPYNLLIPLGGAGLFAAIVWFLL